MMGVAVHVGEAALEINLVIQQGEMRAHFAQPRAIFKKIKRKSPAPKNILRRSFVELFYVFHILRCMEEPRV